MSELTRFEEQIQLSVWKLQNEAYGISIYQHIRTITQKDLERLVKKGFLEAYKGEPTPVRGGQSKRYYRLTELGQDELLRTRKTQEVFWKGLPPLRFQMEKNK